MSPRRSWARSRPSPRQRIIVIYTTQYCQWQYRVQADSSRSLSIAIYTIQYWQWQYRVNAISSLSLFKMSPRRSWARSRPSPRASRIGSTNACARETSPTRNWSKKSPSARSRRSRFVDGLNCVFLYLSIVLSCYLSIYTYIHLYVFMYIWI